MMKRLWTIAAIALLLWITVIFPALASWDKGFTLVDGEGKTWLKFDLQPGMNCLPSPLGEEPEIPPGLEAMYQWIQPEQEGLETWFLRLPHGRVLIGVAHTPVDMAVTAQQLADLWPEMVQHLKKSTQFVNEDQNNADTFTLGDRIWARINTSVVLDGKKMLSLQVAGYANCDDGDMTEVWVVNPAHATYRYDDAAEREMQEDMLVAQAWLDSVTIP